MQGQCAAVSTNRKPVGSEVVAGKRAGRAIEAKFNRISGQLQRRNPVRPERSIARDESLAEDKIALVRVLRDEYQRGVLSDIGAAISRFFAREDEARLQRRAELMASIQELQRDRLEEVLDEFQEVA